MAYDPPSQTPPPSPPPAAPGPAQKKPRKALKALLVVAVVAVVAAAGYLAYNTLKDDSDTASTPATPTTSTQAEKPFTIDIPSGWKSASSKELSKLKGTPLAVIQRSDRKGIVVIRRQGAAPKNFEKFSKGLTKKLKKRVRGFKKRTSRIVRVSGKNAYFYSYTRKGVGTAHTILIVPAGDNSYVLNAVSQPGAKTVPQQIADMIASFKIKQT